jgi:NitT/TauT family transport system ATP-binding protein
VPTIGLLEVLENEGAMELFELTRHVDLELTQLLLVVKAAELLGWVATPSQRVEMTAAGRQFLAADINTRKHLLNARLRDIFVFNLVIQMLKQSGDGEVDEETVLGQLAIHFPHERPQRILRTVVAWARYAELFKYSATRKVLYGLSAQAFS